MEVTGQDWEPAWYPLENVDLACELLGRLRLLGVSVCVDDFGVDQSSLAYLRRLPVDGVKIDRMFVADLRDGPSAEKLVAGIIRRIRHDLV